jgi:molecular chaperone DnaK (HSP70)
MEACEKAKQALATIDSYEIPLPYKGKIEQLQITSEQFENLTQDLVHHTIDKSENALQKAGLTWNTVSRILLVGGSTRLRMVQKRLKQVSGKELTLFQNVDQLVALGAALYTQQKITPQGQRQIPIAPAVPTGIAIASDNSAGSILVTLKESTSHGLGVIIVDRQGGKAKLATSVIIKPQSSIPAVASRDDYKTKPHQTEVHIPIVQADSDGLDPTSCLINKTYRFMGIPDRSQPSQIRVAFSYDKDAMIDVVAHDVQTKTILDKEIIEFTLPEIIEIQEEAQILLILDTSGSMEGEPLEQAKIEVKKVCDDLKDTSCRLGLIQFGAKVNVVYSLTHELYKIKNAVDSLYADNGTPMAEGIHLALAEFRRITGNRVAVLVSDGAPNDKDDALTQANALKNEGVTLFTISIGSSGADFLQEIGDAYTQIASSSGLSEAIGQLLNSL